VARYSAPPVADSACSRSVFKSSISSIPIDRARGCRRSRARGAVPPEPRQASWLPDARSDCPSREALYEREQPDSFEDTPAAG
jgi:hypothetical protein